MANQKDKFSIFLTVIIVLLIVAMGVYAFIYREKIAETIQNFTKKDTKEVYELKTTKKSTEPNEDLINPSVKKSKEEEFAFENPKLEKSKILDPPPVFEPTDSKPRSNLREKEIEKKGDFPRLSEPEDKFLDPEQSPYKKSAKVTENPREELHSEFAEQNNTKKKSYSKKKKRHTTKSKSYRASERNTLETRVRELEEKFGIRPPKKKTSLEKRISRLEKLEQRVNRLEKIASKKEE